MHASVDPSLIRVFICVCKLCMYVFLYVYKVRIHSNNVQRHIIHTESPDNMQYRPTTTHIKENSISVACLVEILVALCSTRVLFFVFYEEL